MKKISVEEALKGSYIFIDVRTPKEFFESTIPNAINIPLFSNQERAVIGKLYFKKGQEEAIRQGVAFVSKKLPRLLKEISKYKNKSLLIFCWRGGMRSESLTALLDALDFNVTQLIGGYKTYRDYVLKKLGNYKLKPKLIVLHGLTGVGKTKILRHFPNSLDLEDLAQHRSSLLGSVNLKPRSQKMFDSLLFNRLEELKNEKFIFIEGEARKIGNVQIPLFLFDAMKTGFKVRITAPFQERVKLLVNEYSKDENELIEKVMLLQKYLGKRKIDLVINLIKKNDFESAAEIILKDYYDPLYKHTVDNIDYDFIVEKDYMEEIKKIIFNLS